MPKSKLFSGLQYLGLPGISRSCVDAVTQLIQERNQIKRALILTFNNSHGFLLTTVEGNDYVIQTGFASGYGGEGPRSFSFVLAILDAHGIEIDELNIDEELMTRVEHQALTTRDIERLQKAKPVRPSRWYDYIHEHHQEDADAGKLWRDVDPILPLAIIDPRIFDLALTFWDDPDKALLTAYRRLEDCVRSRTRLDEHGVRLFQQAFHPDDGKLTWMGLDKGEKSGRLSLFVGVYLTYRNPRAHRETGYEIIDPLLEFLALNNLYHLEKKAVITFAAFAADKANS